MAQGMFEAMPYDLKKLQMEVTDCLGSHIFFPYGRVHSSTYAPTMPEPYDTSVTFRGFFYRADKNTKTEVKIEYSTSYFLKTYTDGENVLWTAKGYEGDKIAQEFPKLERRGQGFFSLAVQIDGDNLRGISNFQKTPSRSMKAIKGFEWTYYVYSDTPIVSLHHYYEDKSQVSNEYWSMHIRRPPIIRPDIGGYAFYKLKYTGGNTEITFNFDGQKGKMPVALTPDEEFTLYVRNSATAYLVYASFQQAIVQVKRAQGTHLPNAEFSDNVAIILAIFERGL